MRASSAEHFVEKTKSMKEKDRERKKENNSEKNFNSTTTLYK